MRIWGRDLCPIKKKKTIYKVIALYLLLNFVILDFSFGFYVEILIIFINGTCIFNYFVVISIELNVTGSNFRLPALCLHCKKKKYLLKGYIRKFLNILSLNKKNYTNFFIYFYYLSARTFKKFSFIVLGQEKYFLKNYGKFSERSFHIRNKIQISYGSVSF